MKQIKYNESPLQFVSNLGPPGGMLKAPELSNISPCPIKATETVDTPNNGTTKMAYCQRNKVDEHLDFAVRSNAYNLRKAGVKLKSNTVIFTRA
jgi:hypothetical protein